MVSSVTNYFPKDFRVASDHLDLDFDTLATHAGLSVPVDGTVATVGPIVASTTFTGQSIGDVHAALGPDPDGFAYARNANPTVTTLEAAIARLESADDAVAFGSGMGAIHATLLALGLAPGDTIVASTDLYGVTRSLFDQLADFEVTTEYADVLNLDLVTSAVSSGNVRALYVESISNPLLRVSDIEGMVEIAKRRRIPLIVDNTFATPYLLRPVEVGADIVIHSASKYISGHGDVTAGLVATSSAWAKRIRAVRTTGGTVLSPFEAWLTLRGLRTLPLRMERHCSNAEVLAHWLDKQSWIERVYFPGLDSNPQRSLAHRLLAGRFGGMLAFDLTAGRKRTLEFIDSLHLITPATTLGDVESLVLYPPLSSHRTLSEEGLAQSGINPGLIRMSVGIESAADLIADLEQASRALQTMTDEKRSRVSL